MGKHQEYIQNFFKRKERTISIELRNDKNKLVVLFPRTGVSNNLPIQERNAIFLFN